MKKKPFEINPIYGKESDQTTEQKYDEKTDEAIEDALKSAFIEEEENLCLPEDFKTSLIARMKETAEADNQHLKPEAGSKGISHHIRQFLNREVEIPLVPVLAASLLLITINIIPLNYEPQPEGRLIEVGGAQLWVPNNLEGEDPGYEN